MKTLAERLRWLAADQKVDQRTIGTKADLSPGFFAGVMTRAKEDPDASIRGHEAVALSNAWGVTLEWLLEGKGPPYKADVTPAYSDSSVPVAKNIPGWSQVLKHDQLVAANSPAGKLITPEAWERSNHAARYLIQGPAAPGDALRIAKLAMEVADEGRFDRAYDANLKELQAGEPAELADAKAFHEAVAAKARGEKPAAPPAGKKPKKGGR